MIEIRAVAPTLPLYQTPVKELDPLIIMDLPTAKHSLDKATENGMKRIPIWEICPNFQPITRIQAQLYVPERSWFADPKHADGLHGEMHLRRVYFNVEILGQMKGLSEKEMRILRATALIHDLQRTNDIKDPQHGDLGADWYAENFQELENRGIHLPENEREIVMTLTRYHAVPYEYVPEAIKENSDVDKLLKIFMIADAGDRYRDWNPKYWPKEEFTHGDKDAALLWQFDQYFTLMSQYIQTVLDCSGQDAVDAVAVDLGILQDKKRTHTTVNSSNVRRLTTVQ